MRRKLKRLVLFVALSGLYLLWLGTLLSRWGPALFKSIKKGWTFLSFAKKKTPELTTKGCLSSG
jgi:hypothetical protein